ncbi:hypothetical protein HAX54_043014 [Datura stramonium]|uniref:Uncharacterized protein n=1 Tax=Datura stramonium TaxID=4076 RepID=A0ABS8W3Z7_DATST|nr:hypothetical protein [Datura stramonium]
MARRPSRHTGFVTWSYRTSLDRSFRLDTLNASWRPSRPFCFVTNLDKEMHYILMLHHLLSPWNGKTWRATKPRKKTQMGPRCEDLRSREDDPGAIRRLCLVQNIRDVSFNT